MELNWEIPHGPGKASPWHILTGYVATEVYKIIHQQMPHLEDYFPFWDHKYAFDGYLSKGWIAARIKAVKSLQMPHQHELSFVEISKLEDVNNPFCIRNIDELSQLLGTDWYSPEIFTYIGPCEDYKISWPHVCELLINWLNKFVLPEALENNRQRVLLALPPTPNFDIDKVLRNIYVLESNSFQGTCFHLKNVGLVTCDHVLRNENNQINENIEIFSHKQIEKKYKVEIINSNETLDIALINAPNLSLNEGFDLGQADSLKQMDHIAVAGFPNYRPGDSGILSPGLVIGFRTVSGIRRILVNASIIAGNSGGPVLNTDGQVIGVAITGADRMENADKTENHGIVPIETINFIKQQ